ncbi:PAS domain S-box protein [Halostella litorea]|uniref:PAS domain S-box protein n=1 Tax=Halostella litorea TaxID=2528831 RepID=UPI0010930F9E|nr:PAS domain S-box protein [Halostella litorea]
MPHDSPSNGAPRSSQHQRLLELITADPIVEGDLQAAARTITETAARVLDVPRVNVWLFDDTADRVTCLDHYDLATDTHGSLLPLPTAAVPDYIEALRSHRSLAATNARSDERTSELAADYLEPNDIYGLLDATIRDEGEIIGMVCHEQTDHPREWTSTETELATHIADIFHRAYSNHQKARQREQLEYQRSLLEAQQESMPDGLLVVDTDGDIRSYNDRFRELWGLPEDVLASGTLADVRNHIKPMLANPAAVAHVAERSTPTSTESVHEELALTDGRVVEGISRPVTSEGGDHLGRLWITRDITDRRERERELELTYRAIEAAPIGITLSDPDQADNPLIYVNEQFQELTGYDADEALGHNCRFLQGENTSEAPVAEMRRAIDAAEPVSVELRNYRKDGTEFWNRVSIAPVEDEAGRISNYVGFQQDVSDRVEATRQLRVLHRVLRHNLANQMSIIRGTAEDLAETTSGEQAAAARMIVEEADQLLSVTDTHRAIVALLNERPAVEPRAINSLLEQAVDAVRADHPAAAITVESGVDDETRVSVIPAVATAFEEVITNAIIHDGGVEPRVVVSVEAVDDQVVVAVRDSGPGLPAEERAILEGTQVVEPLNHGTGMGLWYVYWVLKLSGGMVAVEEAEGGGTTVRLRLRTPE